MKNKYFIAILLLNVCLILSSCRIKGNFQGLYSYYEKSKKNNPNLFVIPEPTNSICTLNRDNVGKIYLTNGKALKNCLENKKNVIVYIWGPKCKSKICYPLETLQQISVENEIELYIVAEYYDNELMEAEYNLKNPILGIDTKYYNSNLTSKYLSEFISDLTNNDYIENKFYVFKDGLFQNSYESIENSVQAIKGKNNNSIIYEPLIRQ